MSYSRFVPHDVYVFMHLDDFLQCCACSLSGVDVIEPDRFSNYNAYSTQDMVDHLVKHKRRKHSVPADIVERLWADDDENFPDGGKSDREKDTYGD